MAIIPADRPVMRDPLHGSTITGVPRGLATHSSSMPSSSWAMLPQVQSVEDPDPWMPTVPPSFVFQGGQALLRNAERIASRCLFVMIPSFRPRSAAASPG